MEHAIHHATKIGAHAARAFAVLAGSVVLVVAALALVVAVFAAGGCGADVELTQIAKAHDAGCLAAGRGAVAFRDGDTLRVVDGAGAALFDADATDVSAIAVGARAVLAVEGAAVRVHTLDGTATVETDVVDPAAAAAALDDVDGGFLVVEAALNHASDTDGDGERDTVAVRIALVETDAFGALRSRVPAPLVSVPGAKMPDVGGVVVDGNDAIVAIGSHVVRIDRTTGTVRSDDDAGHSVKAIGLRKGKVVVGPKDVAFLAGSYAATSTTIQTAPAFDDAHFAEPGDITGLAWDPTFGLLFASTKTGVFTPPASE